MLTNFFTTFLVDWSMPILTILNTGDPVRDDPFNYFFSLMLGIGFLLFIPAAIFAAISVSMRE
jgi:hypothetical protein